MGTSVGAGDRCERVGLKASPDVYFLLIFYFFAVFM